MKQILFLMGLGCGVVLAAPAIYCGQPEWAFGTVSDAVCITNRFVIENRGDSSLLIREVRSSCGCTAALLPAKQLTPGGTMPLTVVFDPAGRSGAQRKTVTLFSNDARQRAFKLQLAGRVQPQVVSMPSTLVFVARASDEMIERRLTLTYDRPVTIRALKIDSAAVTAASVLERASKSHVVEVKIDPTRLSGRFRAELEIETDHPAEPVTRVPVSGRIK